MNISQSVTSEQRAEGYVMAAIYRIMTSIPYMPHSTRSRFYRNSFFVSCQTTKRCDWIQNVGVKWSKKNDRQHTKFYKYIHSFH